jgi:hypothetical protein
MGDSISTALSLIDDRLEELHASLTDEPIDGVRERYRAWKDATRAVLARTFVESAVSRFERAEGPVVREDGRRPTPPVFLDGAASRACLMAIKKDLESDPATVLRVPPPETISAQRLGLFKVLGLLERRLPRAFRGRPGNERDLSDGFEALLAGAGIAYERESDPIVQSSRTCVPGFTFPGLRTALELKLCDRPEREAEIVAEIEQEIPVYRARYPQVIFGIYDLGFIRRPERISPASAADPDVFVRVMKPL